jgi:tripartite-type tricarboxylate transporter receptor subunit TctC
VPHLLTELLKISAHINILDVPYKGGAPATIDTMGGEVDMLFSVLPLVLPNIKTGQLRPIAIASAVRSPLIPDVPTTVEQGYADVIGSAWNGVVAPANTPREIVDMLNGEISQILSAADTAQRFNALGMEAMGGTSQSFAQFLQAESDKWAKVIATAHVQAEQ